jgi:hypothetical protein
MVQPNKPVFKEVPAGGLGVEFTTALKENVGTKNIIGNKYRIIFNLFLFIMFSILWCTCSGSCTYQ